MHNKRKWHYYDIHNPLDEGKTSGEKIYVFSTKKRREEEWRLAT